MIRFVYFDVDDTLLDHRHAERKALEEVHEQLGNVLQDVPVSLFQDAYHRYNVQLWHQYAHGEIDKATLRIERFRHLQETFNLHHIPAEYLAETYMAAYTRHWRWVPGAQKAYLTLAKHLHVGLLTNGFAEVQQAKLRRFPELREHAQAIVISEEVGVMKPHPNIFAHATRKADVAPEDILYVGDSYTSDVLGGHRAGWQVAWYRREGASQPTLPSGTYVFATWPELLEWLEINVS